MAKLWYVVHTYSGYENRAKAALEQRIKEMGKDELFGQVLVPSEKVVEVVKGEKRTSSRKFFPGYILVQMELNDETWYLVKNTPKVTGFVGGATNPTPISDAEVEQIIGQMEEGRAHPKPKYEFGKGEQVKVIEARQRWQPVDDAAGAERQVGGALYPQNRSMAHIRWLSSRRCGA